MSDIEIEIDGKPLKAKPNSMIIQVADEAGIYIPRFCYHKHLSIAANCRMCLVDVEKAPKPAPACATPVMPGMKVFTRSPKALAAQRAVMEFLLINHPLDCPICDQGGECELQDLSMGYGAADSYYTFGKRSVKDENLGPLIASDMTRCIQCTRCVRFGDEVAGLRELGAVNRGEDMEIGTYIQKSITSEVSGNVIDICPVGALTSKPYRFTARAWELNQFPSIAAHDCLGSHIHVHTRYGQVKRVIPRENDAINQTWISDRDRFSYQGIYHSDRLAKPLIRVKGELQETDWQTALEKAAHRLQEVIHQHGAEQIAALASPNSTLEELYLLQKIMRGLGCDNLDYRLRQTDFSDDVIHAQGDNTDSTNLTDHENAISIAEIEQADSILLVGSHIQKEQPLLGLRIRKAALKGAKVMAINMVDYRFHFAVTARRIVAPHDIVSTLAAIVNALSESHLDIIVTETDRLIAEQLRAGKKITIILGALALNHPHAATIKKLTQYIAKQCNGQLLVLTEGANATGAELIRKIPAYDLAIDRSQSDASVSNVETMLKNPRKAYLLLNLDPELDCANPVAMTAALEQSDCVIALSCFKNPILDRCAEIIFPIGTFAETAGTFVNVERKWQTFQGAATPFEEARPGWKVLRVLGNFLHLNHFEYDSVDVVTEEIKAMVNNKTSSNVNLAAKDLFQSLISDLQLDTSKGEMKSFAENILSRIGEIPMYATDSLVRRATALQEMQSIVEGDLSMARLHPKTAARLNIKENDLATFKQKNNQVRLSVRYDDRIPEQAVWIAGGISATSGLTELLGEIEVEH